MADKVIQKSAEAQEAKVTEKAKIAEGANSAIQNEVHDLLMKQKEQVGTDSKSSKNMENAAPNGSAMKESLNDLKEHFKKGEPGGGGAGKYLPKCELEGEPGGQGQAEKWHGKPGEGYKGKYEGGPNKEFDNEIRPNGSSKGSKALEQGLSGKSSLKEGMMDFAPKNSLPNVQIEGGGLGRGAYGAGEAIQKSQKPNESHESIMQSKKLKALDD
ncbi:MAG: hypothetical protein IAF58_14685 [Leptolyngbya sp.]|nr:hypothetical protein [Candidatus Melainabacteria bacterium]